MAKLQKRLRADGGTSFRVMWVIGGGRAVPGAEPGTAGSQASETFTDERLMLAFKLAVEAQGHRWPADGSRAAAGWTLRTSRWSCPLWIRSSRSGVRTNG